MKSNLLRFLLVLGILFFGVLSLLLVLGKSGEHESQRLPDAAVVQGSSAAQNEPSGAGSSSTPATAQPTPGNDSSSVTPAVSWEGKSPEQQQQAALDFIRGAGRDNHKAIIQEFLLDGIPPAAATVFFEEILSMPNEVKLPAFLEAFASRNHPSKDDVVEQLILYAGQDLGDDPGAWRSEISRLMEEEKAEKNLLFQ